MSERRFPGTAGLRESFLTCPECGQEGARDLHECGMWLRDVRGWWCGTCNGVYALSRWIEANIFRLAGWTEGYGRGESVR